MARAQADPSFQVVDINLKFNKLRWLLPLIGREHEPWAHPPRYRGNPAALLQRSADGIFHHERQTIPGYLPS